MVQFSINTSTTRFQKPPDDRWLEVPFTVAVDHRERAAGWRFSGLRAGSQQNYRPLLVKTVEKHLVTGDYAIEGLESLVCIERKSLSDLQSSATHGRERFEAEHERMRDMILSGGYAAVVIESPIEAAMDDLTSRVKFASLNGTRLSWAIEYGISWMFERSRRDAEETAFRLLEMFWRKHTHLLEKAGKAEKGIA